MEEGPVEIKIRQLYKKDTGLDLIRPEGPPSQNFCENVKNQDGKIALPHHK